MGNCLSQDESKAIEVVERLLNRTSLREIAGHPAASQVHSLFTRATAEDRHSLLEALGLLPSPRPNTQVKSNQHGGGRPSDITSDDRVHRALEEIKELEQDQPFTSVLEGWKKDVSSFWHIEADTFFQRGTRKIDCVCNVYAGLDRVKQDDLVNGIRYRFLLVMLRYMRDRVTSIAALSEGGTRGQSNVSKATIRIAHAISQSHDQSSSAFKKAHSRLKQLHKRGNKYVSTTETLGAGILFLLGGIRACRFWDHNIQLEDIRQLKHHLGQHADVSEKTKSLNDLAEAIVHAGLEECGWTAFETAEKGKVSTQNGHWQAATSEAFFGVCTSNLVGESLKRRCDHTIEIPQEKLQILSTAVKRSRHEYTGSHPIPVDSNSSDSTTTSSRPANSPSTRELDIGADLGQSHAPVGQEVMLSTLADDHTARRLPDMVMAANYPPTPGIYEDSPSANLPSTPTLSQHPVTACPTSMTGTTALPFEQLQECEQAQEFSTLFTSSIPPPMSTDALTFEQADWPLNEPCIFDQSFSQDPSMINLSTFEQSFSRDPSMIEPFNQEFRQSFNHDPRAIDTDEFQ